MEVSLSGKNVLVTGSAGLIGSELCRQLAASGANLLLLDTSPANAALRESLAAKHAGQTILQATIDVGREEAARTAAVMTEESFSGTLHGLVNAVQYKSQSFFHDIKDTSLSELQDIFAANVFSIFWMMKHLTPALRKAQGASVVNFSSTYAVVSPNPDLYTGTNLGCPPTYVATKGAVHSLTRYLACYLAPDRIRVNSVTPHGVANNHQPQFVENFSRLSPLGRMSRSDEVAPAVLLLLSDQGSYITGVNLAVDGGWTAW
ncbi:MAG: SDR family NAD(P)-dependent oxidoreductase [Vicinamibacterales bacterium]